MLYPQIDFATAVKLRIDQAAGLAFLFVPINTIAYAGVPRSKNNQVSGLMNLARNMGGSVGIAAITTLVARRAQLHQNRLVEFITPLDPVFERRLAGLAATLHTRGLGAVEAMRRAQALVYAEVQRQAVALAYIDTIHVLALACVAMAPCVLLLRSPPKGAAPCRGASPRRGSKARTSGSRAPFF